MTRSILGALAFLLAGTSAYAVPLSQDSQISLTGYVQAQGSVSINAATGLSFANSSGSISGNQGDVGSYGGGYGDFSGFSCGGGSCGTIKNIDNLTVGGQTITDFLSLQGGNNALPINFTLLGITSINRDTDYALGFTAVGLINYAGFDPTVADYSFTSQGNDITSFSATTNVRDGFGSQPGSGTPVPEPMSLALLGGALAAVGLLRRAN